MKVLVFNSSPRGEGQSKTEMILNPLVEGMREAGDEVEVVNLRPKRWHSAGLSPARTPLRLS